MTVTTATNGSKGLIATYRDYLPIAESVQPISLCEGNTPLIELVNISAAVGGNTRIFAKFEGLNPTGSFKDRGMTMAVTMAKHNGMSAVVCASTGNTSASAAAYAARAKMQCFVLIPEGKIAFGKLSQALVHGAQVVQIRGNFDQAMSLVKDLATSLPIDLVNSVNHYRLQGQKTIAFEVLEQLGTIPDYHAVPVGNAANISAHWMGYNELCGEQRMYPKSIAQVYEANPIATPVRADSKPVMLGYQAAGAASMVEGKNIEHPETIASAIRIGNPQSRAYAQEAVTQSEGWFACFDDAIILKTQRLLAQEDGIFCEPASAVSLAGVLADIEHGRIAKGATVVCTLTGFGIKDPDTVVDQFKGSGHIVTVDPDYDRIYDLMKGVDEKKS